MKPSAILSNVYTAAQVADTNDVINAINTILERLDGASWTAIPSVFKRMVSLSKKYNAFKAKEGRAFLYSSEAFGFCLASVEAVVLACAGSVVPTPERRFLKAGDTLTEVYAYYKESSEPREAVTVDTIAGIWAYMSNGMTIHAELLPAADNSGLWLVSGNTGRGTRMTVYALDSTIPAAVEPVAHPAEMTPATAFAVELFDASAHNSTLTKIDLKSYQQLKKLLLQEGFQPLPYGASMEQFNFPSQINGVVFELSRHGKNRHGYLSGSKVGKNTLTQPTLQAHDRQAESDRRWAELTKS